MRDELGGEEEEEKEKTVDTKSEAKKAKVETC